MAPHAEPKVITLAGDLSVPQVDAAQDVYKTHTVHSGQSSPPVIEVPDPPESPDGGGRGCELRLSLVPG